MDHNGAMHELGLLVEVVRAVAATVEAGPRPRRVVAVGMRVGALSGASVEALRGAWPLATAGTCAQGARLEIEELAASVACPKCGEVEVDEFFALTCPRCSTPTGTFVHGREAEVAWAELEEVGPGQVAPPGP